MVDLTPFKASIDAARLSTPPVCHDPKSAFLDILASDGFTPPRALQIGRLERIDGPEDKRGKKSGWYVYNEIEDSRSQGHIIGVANYGDWKTGLSKDWCSRSQHQMNTQERLHYHTARENMRADYERETLEKNKEAAAKAFEIWSEAEPATEHGYLKKKKVKAHTGLKIAKDKRLIIPIAINNEIVSLQFIDPAGEKRFLTGGKTKGGWFVIEGTTDIVYIAEGYATAASVHEATGATVYIAFNAGNIYEVAGYIKSLYPGKRLIIAGDDDTGTAGNPGRTKATQAAEGLGLEVTFPQGYVDFNDQLQGMGLSALKDYLNPKKLETYKPEKPPENLIKPPAGILNDITDYYHATSGNAQHGFALQTALAVTSIILGRAYKTSLENFPSLYFLNVGKSGTGKEHAKKVIEKILYQAGIAHYIAGDGYTSAGAVFSTLLKRPKHLCAIDEFGRYLEAGIDTKKGNHHQREANTKLMEAIGRCDGIIRPPSYSSMTLKKEAAEAIENRQVHNPAITILAMTTPVTLFKTLDMGAIHDGFFNRFIVSISDAERTIRKHKQPIDVPDRILRWINDVLARSYKPHIASEPAAPVVLEFTDEARAIETEFQAYCIEKANYLERFGMAELTGRSVELAMRVSLIAALARDPKTSEIRAEDMTWAVSYIKHCLERTIEKLKISVSHSSFEGQKKEILADLRSRGEQGITWSNMQKTPPYSQHKQKDLRDILQSLKDAHLADEQPYQHQGAGRPTTLWIALK